MVALSYLHTWLSSLPEQVINACCKARPSLKKSPVYRQVARLNGENMDCGPDWLSLNLAQPPSSFTNLNKLFELSYFAN